MLSVPVQCQHHLSPGWEGEVVVPKPKALRTPHVLGCELPQLCVVLLPVPPSSSPPNPVTRVTLSSR
eukprot:477536-Amphidinium_carterae.3